MDSLIQIFDKMNSKTKNQMIVIVIGLIMPSLIYLTLNFPNQLYNSNILIVLIMGICANFTCIFILALFSMFTNQFGQKNILNLIDNCLPALNTLIEKTEFNKIIKLEQAKQFNDLEINIELENSITAYRNELYNIEDDLDALKRFRYEIINYQKELFDLINYFTDSSFTYIIMIPLISLINLTPIFNVTLSVSSISKNLLLFFIGNTIAFTFKNIHNTKSKYKRYEQFCNDYKLV